MDKFKLQILGTFSILIATTVVLLISVSFIAFRGESINLNTEILRVKNDVVNSEISKQISVYQDMLAGIQVSNSDVKNMELQANATHQLKTLYNQFGAVADGTYLFTKDGDIWDRNGGKLGINVKTLNREYYVALYNNNDSFFMSAPFTSGASGKEVLGMAYKTNNDVAVLATINVEALLESVYNRKDMFVFTPTGTILIAPYPEFVNKNIFEERPLYKGFNKDNPELTYQATVDGDSVAFTALWSKIEANDWQFVTFIRNNTIAENAQSQLVRSIILALICLLAALVAAWVVVEKLVIKPVGGTPGDIEKMIGVIAEGDLKQKLQETGMETGIYRSLVKLSNQLAQLIENSHQISENVSSASLQLNNVMADTQKNAQEEMHQVEQIATAINELSSTSQEVSSRANEAQAETVKAQENVANGQQTLEKNYSLTQEINESFSETASLVDELRQFALEIGSVTDVIKGISEQTNLLALNAAIEAARAGEQGRGFAVVADEVRNLASKTQESTVSIQEIIEKLQSQSERASGNMNKNIELIAQSVELADSIKAAFEDISESVQSITEVNELVATASHEQFSVTEDISKNTSDTFTLVQKNASAVEQSLKASSELSELANTQKEELGYFTV